MDTTRAEPLSSSDGTLLYWVGVNLDIDDAMRAEETLTAVRERLALATEVATGTQLSAAIAYEIVQPLSAIVANARAALHWLEGDPKDIARAASLIEIVLRDGMSIGNVVHEMGEAITQPGDCSAQRPHPSSRARRRKRPAMEGNRTLRGFWPHIFRR